MSKVLLGKGNGAETATRPFLPPATQNRTLSTSFFLGFVLAPPEGEGPVLGGVRGGGLGGY